MDTIQLREPTLLPSNEVLKDVLGTSYSVFEQLTQTLTDRMALLLDRQTSSAYFNNL